MDYVLPSSTVSPSVSIFLALISIAAFFCFTRFYMSKNRKKWFFVLAATSCLGIGSALSLFTISMSLSIADDKARGQYEELITVNNMLDGVSGLP